MDSFAEKSDTVKKIFLKGGKGWKRSLGNYLQNHLASHIDAELVTVCELDDCDHQSCEEIKSCKCVARNVVFEAQQKIKNQAEWGSLLVKYTKLNKPGKFTQMYPNELLESSFKIGEGYHSDIYILNSNKNVLALKIVPIGSGSNVNQKTLLETDRDIAMATQLSKLAENQRNFTDCFNQVISIKWLCGEYPDNLCANWNLYYQQTCSQNVNPAIYDNEQLYVAYEFIKAGKSLSKFRFSNAQQAHAVFMQVAVSLAVAEVELKFEHRDLNLDNILVTQLESPQILNFVLHGHKIQTHSYGIKVRIIGYSLAYMHTNDYYTYCDLSDETAMFLLSSDPQFDVYRQMKMINNNDWSTFKPLTNILWLRYLIVMMLSTMNYTDISSDTHKMFIDILNNFKSTILNYASAEEFIMKYFELSL